MNFHPGRLALLLRGVHPVAGIVLLNLGDAGRQSFYQDILITFMACIFFLMASILLRFNGLES